MIVVLLLFAILISLYFFTTRHYGYWNKKKLPHLKPIPLFGNFKDLLLFKSNIGSLEQKICNNFIDAPLIGAYFGTEPALIVQDPEIIKTVTTKDFYYFSNREVSEHVYKERLMKNLFGNYGDEWKVLRQNLTPLFSSAKMKNMFYLIDSCSKIFEKLLDDEISLSQSQEVRKLMGRFTLDCIGNCAFGLNTNAMDKSDENNPFRSIADLIFETTRPRGFKFTARAIWPGIFYGLGLTVLPRDVDSFFTNLLTGVFDERQGKDRQNTRHDFVDLLMGFYNNKYMVGDSMKNLKTGEKVKKQLNTDYDLLVAQCFVFFAAGFETSATTSSFTLYELAKHPEVQERARNDVDECLRKHNGVLGYECVTEVPFLEQCIDEALRLYPVLGVITREVVEPYVFPGTDIKVEKGLRVHLPVFHLQRNPKYFPKPEQYDPDRFSPDAKKNITPYTYFPFGEGPRICIGMRFAKMQMIAGLITVLKKYRVELADDMPKTIEFEPKSMVTQSKHGIRLKFIPRTDRVPVMYTEKETFSHPEKRNL